jgi:hypothetical protein
MTTINRISQQNILYWEAFVAGAAAFAQVNSPRIERRTFNSKTMARAWVEEARRRWWDPAEFAATVQPIFTH